MDNAPTLPFDADTEVKTMIDIARFSAAQLLALHASVTEELRRRKITRSSNNPTGDLAKHFVGHRRAIQTHIWTLSDRMGHVTRLRAAG
jgi:hypothetical protein